MSHAFYCMELPRRAIARTRRAGLALVCAALIGAALAGCGGGESSSAVLVSLDGASDPIDAALSDGPQGSADAAGDTVAAEVAPQACKSDGDCTGPLKVCDPLGKLCVACLGASDCAATEHCQEKSCVAFAACKNSLDCGAARGPGGVPLNICDPDLGECVACVGASDCPPQQDCLGHTCVPYVPCKNSTDCPTDQVCAPSSGRCVQCTSEADCGPSQVCQGNQCLAYVACVSDKQCTGLGLLCDKTKGKCAQCLTDDDCPDAYFCAATGAGGTGNCALDQCQAGSSTCQGNATAVCAANGSSYGTSKPCADKTTCVAANAAAQCEAWQCQPGASCANGQAVQCSSDGLHVLSSTLCPPGTVCSAGACVAALCKPGALQCQGNAVFQCSGDGLALQQVQACTDSQYCEAGQCQALVCLPNQAQCQGNEVKTCNSNGSAYLPNLACGNQTCVNGACQTLLCQPATLWCHQGKLATCSPDGLSIAAEKDCGASAYCGIGGNGDAACLPMQCQPGTPVCAAKQATTCKDDGSGPSPGGIDCPALGKVCSKGLCANLMCDPSGGPYCDGNTIKQCDATGLNPTVAATCGAGQFCSQGACQNQICTPNSPQCNGNLSTTCNAQGSGLSPGGSDCGAAKCEGGVCKAVICTPNQATCVNGTIKTCSGSGTGYVADKPCGTGTYCAVAASGAVSCLPMQCDPGKPVCMGTISTLCKTDGSGYQPGGTDCSGSGKICSGGACTSKTCDPQTPLYCAGNVVTKCDASGTVATPLQTCGSGQYCSGGACQNQVCAPNTPLCNGNTATTCNSQGSGLAPGGTDCGSQKCVAGACKPVVCAPNSTSCSGSTLVTCNGDGTAIATSKPCGSGNYCGPNGNNVAACLPAVCSAGQPACNGKLATTCKADGSGYVAGGTDCSLSGKICSSGACAGGVCDPSKPFFCDGNVAKLCENNGASSSTLQECNSDQICDQGACSNKVCAPGAPLCSGSLASVCNSSGSGAAPGGVDCTASGKVCSAGACIAGYPSCAAILAGNKGAKDGLYPIDPDGAGSQPILWLFCDMTGGGLTLMGNFFDSAADDMPNSPDLVLSGWQQDGSGSWKDFPTTVDRVKGGSMGSAAVGLAYAAALAKNSGQSRVRLCFVDDWGTDSVCRDTYNGSLVPASYSGGNPLLANYANDAVTYTYARLAGAPGKTNSYAPGNFGSPSSAAAGYCIGRSAGSEVDFGTQASPGLCDSAGAPLAGVWVGVGNGMAYAPYKVSNDELAGVGGANPSTTSFGFRVYFAQNPACGNQIKETGEGCDDGNSVVGDGCSACQLEPPKAQIGDLLITEIMARPATVSNEWFEVLNVSNHAVDLNGLYVGDDQYYFKLAKPNGFFLKQNEYALIAAVDLAKYEAAAAPDYVYGAQTNGVAFANSGDVLCISLDAACTPAARVAYVSFGAQTQNVAYQLSNLALSSSGAAAPSNWCMAKVAYGNAGNKGTPRDVNSTCP
ncbi:MAG: lamin tail domain-containing protein [Deltaproteobacteria bacterium]|nr:lamin tail domain-containing protein [Deltaproteobacteria bacterium]